ncbi:TetR/AcrR family transcriptional regulator [Streptomyces sp. 900116325]
MTPAKASESDQQTVGAPRRSDARRNHERVVAAAVEIFRECGTQASVPQIAARAQVGKATVYRSFPVKEDLLEAITGLSLERLEQRTASALREADPYEAFRLYVLELFEALARDRLLAERLADATSPAAASVLETLVTAMERARAAEKLREDVTQMDLRVVLCGTALQLVRLTERDPATWHRYGNMVLAALRR